MSYIGKPPIKSILKTGKNTNTRILHVASNGVYFEDNKIHFNDQMKICVVFDNSQ